jgi:hypothetical protein
MHGLSCFLSNPLLPTDVASIANANQNQSPQSNSLPWFPFGIVVAATPGISYSFTLPLAQSHRLYQRLFVASVRSYYCWCFVWFIHFTSTAAASCCYFFNRSLDLVVVRALAHPQQSVFTLRIFHVAHLLESYGSSCCIVLSLTKQSSRNSNSLLR